MDFSGAATACVRSPGLHLGRGDAWTHRLSPRFPRAWVCGEGMGVMLTSCTALTEEGRGGEGSKQRGARLGGVQGDK